MIDYDDLSIAVRFHDTYERLAPQFGYETRPDTKAFDPTSPNGRLMQEVCREVAAPMIAEIEALRARVARLEEALKSLTDSARLPPGVSRSRFVQYPSATLHAARAALAGAP